MAVIFTFNNTRDAIAGERCLLDGGIKVVVMALPASLGAGCGLCLRVAPAELDNSRRRLLESNLIPEAVYAGGNDNGQTVYTLLKEPMDVNGL